MSPDDERQPSVAPSATDSDVFPNPEGKGNTASEAAAKDPLDEARAETQRVRDQLLRTAADYDNFRKRSRRENDEAQKRGREELIRELLPVFDNLERAVVHAGQATDAKAVADGVGMVLKQFVDTLARVGISRLKVVGRPFDPTQHEAIQQVETDEHPPGTVIAEVQPGYLLGDRLLRAAMVVVAKPALKNGDASSKVEPN